jgi:hypothetical protein
MKWPAVLILAAAITSSCRDGSGPALPELHGTYALSSKSGDPVPFPATCGNFMVESGAVTLGALGSASYELRYRGAQNDSIYSYTSAGQYAQTGAQLRLNVTGRWSHHSQSATTRYDFQILENGNALSLMVGTECDGSETEVYRLTQSTTQLMIAPSQSIAWPPQSR